MTTTKENTKLSNYEFEYFFLPVIIEKDENLLAFRSWNGLQQELLFQKSSFDFSSLKITHQMQKDWEYFLLKFPNPQNETDAYWGLIVNFYIKKPLYFTLEMGHNNLDYLCRVSTNEHTNISTIPSTISQENFINKVFEYIELNKKFTCSYGKQRTHI